MHERKSYLAFTQHSEVSRNTGARPRDHFHGCRMAGGKLRSPSTLQRRARRRAFDFRFAISIELVQVVSMHISPVQSEHLLALRSFPRRNVLAH